MGRELVLVVVFALPAFIAAQSPPPVQAERARFDAVSVKPNLSKTPGIMRRPTPGRVFFGNAPVTIIVEEAYGARPDRILNYPSWVDTERFDVTATYNPDTQAQVRPMLQALLEERFSLRVHREVRELAVYELVKARADGQLGPGLRASSADCQAPVNGRSPCVMDIREGFIRTIGTRWTPAGSMLPSNIGVWDRPIVDRTGLNGIFDISLEWKPDPGQARDVEAAARASAAAAATPGDRTSIFTALEEQLGLRLQPARAPLEVLVIDKLERPTPD